MNLSNYSNSDSNSDSNSEYSDDFLKKLGIIGACETLHSEESFKGLTQDQQISILKNFTYVLQYTLSHKLVTIPIGWFLDEMAPGTESDTFADEFRLFAKRVENRPSKDRIEYLLCHVCNQTFIQNTVTAFQKEQVTNNGPGPYDLIEHTIVGIEQVLEAPLYLQEKSKVETLNPYVTIQVKQDVVLSSLTFIGNFLLAYLDHLLASLNDFSSVEQCKPSGTWLFEQYKDLQEGRFFEKRMVTCVEKLIDQQNEGLRFIYPDFSPNPLKEATFGERNIDNSTLYGYINSAAEFLTSYFPFLEEKGILSECVIQYAQIRSILAMYKMTIEILLDDPVMEHPLWQDVSSQKEQYSIPLTVPNILASMKNQVPSLSWQTYHQPDKIRTRAKKVDNQLPSVTWHTYANRIMNLTK